MSALLLAAVAALPTVGASAAAGGAPTFHTAAGITVHSSQRLSDRLYDVKVSSPAIGAPLDLRILVPAGYAQTTTRYPVLHLYAGTSQKAPDWVTSGHADTLTAALPLIVVMPDIGFGTPVWFSDWVDQSTSDGPSQWETFYINQLVPWVDANLRTRAERSGRAIAGLSQGGFGSTIGATRHPDLFAAVGSFSGANNVAYGVGDAAAGHAFVASTLAAIGAPPSAIFGNPTTNEIGWQGNDAATLVANLAGMDVRLYTGNGTPGPFDSLTDPGVVAAGAVEAFAWRTTHVLADHAAALGVPVNLVDYGPGTHSWPYWSRDLAQFLPHAMKAFTTGSNRPAHVSYLSIRKAWTQWGWSVALDRTAEQEFSQLDKAGADGFTLKGTGQAIVTTPAFYRPGTALTISVTQDGHSGTRSARADAAGRAHLEVDLDDVPLPTPTAADGTPRLPTSMANVTIRAAATSTTSTKPAGMAGVTTGGLPATGGSRLPQVLGAGLLLVVLLLHRRQGSRTGS